MNTSSMMSPLNRAKAVTPIPIRPRKERSKMLRLDSIAISYLTIVIIILYENSVETGILQEIVLFSEFALNFKINDL
ncbi:hypothetical protein AltI4_19010 [Alteromonas sp. I4]|nr:hypothetical protein AltI4_19010 [Alteromonas sp. I4]